MVIHNSNICFLQSLWDNTLLITLLLDNDFVYLQIDRINNHRDNRVNVKINGSTSTRPIKLDALNEIVGVVKASTSFVTILENGHISKERIPQRIPTQKQLVDPYRQGLIIERGVGHRQTVVVRSYEVGPYKTSTLESLFNLFQVIKLNLYQLNSSVPCT